MAMKVKRSFLIAGGAVLLAGMVGGGMAVEAWGSGRAGGGFCGHGWSHHGRGGKDMAEFMTWRMEKMAKELNLTAPQKEKLDRLQNNIKSHVGDVMNDRLGLRQDVHSEMEKDVPDVGALVPKVKTAIQGMSDKMQENVDLFAAFYDSLDNNQKRKLASHVRERMERHGR
jgi:hypothetical protein